MEERRINVETIIENKFKLGQRVRVKDQPSSYIFTIYGILFEDGKVTYRLTTPNQPSSFFREEDKLEPDTNEMPEIKLGMIRRFRWKNQPDYDQLVTSSSNHNREDIVMLWDSIEDYRNDKVLWAK